MMLCKDCQYWTPFSYKPVEHYCALASSEDGDPLFKATLAYASDYESYKALLITEPDYGCVQAKLRLPSQVPSHGSHGK